MESRLEVIPTSIDESSIILKDFNTSVLVGSVSAEGRNITRDLGPPINIAPSPIIAPLQRKKLASAKREKYGEMEESSKSANKALLANATHRLLPMTKKRSMTRKTATISPFPPTPMSAWPDTKVQVTERNSPSSPRKKIRKTRVLSPTISVDSPPPPSKSAKKVLFSPPVSALGLEGAVPPSKINLNSDLDEKVKSLLGQTTVPPKPQSAASIAAEKAKTAAEQEKEINEKYKQVELLLKSQQYHFNPRPKVSTGKENTTSQPIKSAPSNAKAAEAPIAVTKPAPDPKVSKEAQKYMKEKKEKLKKDAQLLKDEKDAEAKRIATNLANLDKGAKLQLQEQKLRKTKQAVAAAAKSTPVPVKVVAKSVDIKASTVNPAPAPVAVPVQASLMMAEVKIVPAVEKEAQIVTVPIAAPTTIQIEPRRLSHLGTMLELEKEGEVVSSLRPIPENASPVKAEVVQPIVHAPSSATPKEVVPPATTNEVTPLASAPVPAVAMIPLAVNSVEVKAATTQPEVPEAMMNQVISIAHLVVQLGEKLTGIEQHLAKPAPPPQPQITIHSTTPRLVASKEEVVGVGSLHEFSKKRKDLDRCNDAALVIQAFYKKQKRKGSLTIPPPAPQTGLSSVPKPSVIIKQDEEAQLMKMLAISNRRADSPSRVKPLDSTLSPQQFTEPEKRSTGTVEKPFIITRHDEDAQLMKMLATSNRKADSPSQPLDSSLVPQQFIEAERPEESRPKTPVEPVIMEMLFKSNQKPKSPQRESFQASEVPEMKKTEPRSVVPKAVLFQEDVETRYITPAVIKTIPGNSLGLIQEALTMEMFDTVNKKPQSPSRVQPLLDYTPPIMSSFKAEVKAAEEKVPIVFERNQNQESILDVLTRKVFSVGGTLPLLKKEAPAPDQKLSVPAPLAAEHDTKIPAAPISQPKQETVRAFTDVIVEDVSSLAPSKTVSKEIQTEMEVSDVSELSEIIISPPQSKIAVAPVPQAQVDPKSKVEIPEEKYHLEPDTKTDDYYNMSFDSLSSESVQRKPVSPPPHIRAPIKRARQLVGEALRRDLMGLDGQGRLSPGSLGRRYDYESNNFDAVNEIISQTVDLDHNRQSALIGEETAALVQIALSASEKNKVGFKDDSGELAAATQKRLDSVAKAHESHQYADYDSSFESFSEAHSVPKIINHRNSKSSLADDDEIIEEIIEVEFKEPVKPPAKKKSEKSTIHQLLDSAIQDTIPTSIKKSKAPIVLESTTTHLKQKLHPKDADLLFKMKMAEADTTPAALPPKQKAIIKKKPKVTKSDDSISEDLPFSISSSLASSISEHLATPSQKGKHDEVTDLYDIDSFYSAEPEEYDEMESEESLLGADFVEYRQLMENYSNVDRKLDPKLLARKGDILQKVRSNFESLKERAEQSRTLDAEGKRISKLLAEVMNGTFPIIEKQAGFAPKTEDEANDREIIDISRNRARQAFNLKSLEDEVLDLKSKMDSYQDDLRYFGQSDSPRKRALLLATTNPSVPAPSVEALELVPPTVLVPSKDNDKHMAVHDDMIIRLAAQILSLKEEIEVRKAAVDRAKVLEKEIYIQQLQAALSGLQQQSEYYRNQLENPSSFSFTNTITVPSLAPSLAPFYPESAPVQFVANLPSTPSVLPHSVPLSVPLEKTPAQAANISPPKEVKQALIETSLVQPKAEDDNATSSRNIETEDTTSDIISEKFGDFDEIASSEHVSIAANNPNAPVVVAEKDYDYEDDFEEETDSGLSSKRGVVAIRPSSITPQKDSPEFVDLLTESIFKDLTESALDSVCSFLRKGHAKPKIIIPLVTAASETKKEVVVKTVVEPVWTFSNDLDKGLEILLPELSRFLPPGSKFIEPPTVPTYVYDLLPVPVASILVDALESSLYSQFEKHRIYNRPNRPYYEKKLVKPSAIPSEKLIQKSSTTLKAWIQYPKTHGTDIDQMLAETVKEEGRGYCDMTDDEAKVKLEIADALLEDLIHDTAILLISM